MADHLSLFTRWLRDAPAGERTVYHVGNLARDRVRYPQLDARAREALDAANAGLVHLIQHRFYDLSAALQPRSVSLASRGYGAAYVYMAERTAKPAGELRRHDRITATATER